MKTLYILLILPLLVYGQLSFFNVIQFPDDPCDTSNGKQGICLTSEECSNRDGDGLGNCANGYGVCCLVSLECGESSSSNNTYLTLSTSSPPRTCTYSICKSKDTICRIRFGFETFDIADAVEGTASDTAASTSIVNTGALGDCVTDAFSVNSPGNAGSPIICGFNTGQHLFVDAPENQCVTATFVFGTSTESRQYDIKVAQYQCGAEAAGPPDCLQYHTGLSGTIANFGFPTTSTSVSATTTHLSSQRYNICFRRDDGYCAVCFYPKITTGTQASFGLGVSEAEMAAQSEADGNCDQDFISIPFGLTTSAIYTSSGPIGDESIEQGVDRCCGRFLNTDDGQTSSVSVCTRFRPFHVTVNFDADEKPDTLDQDDARENEAFKLPGGIVGFYLTWKQEKCAS